jgi:hypothetical protein
MGDQHFTVKPWNLVVTGGALLAFLPYKGGGHMGECFDKR